METSSRYLSLLLVYAPTVKAAPSVEAKFTDNLQHALNTLPAGDIVVVLGDFNAQIEKKKDFEDDVRPLQINFLFPVLHLLLFLSAIKFHYSVFFNYFLVSLERFKGSQIECQLTCLNRCKCSFKVYFSN